MSITTLHVGQHDYKVVCSGRWEHRAYGCRKTKFCIQSLQQRKAPLGFSIPQPSRTTQHRKDEGNLKELMCMTSRVIQLHHKQNTTRNSTRTCTIIRTSATTINSTRTCNIIRTSATTRNRTSVITRTSTMTRPSTTTSTMRATITSR